ncbi:hypothetical protein Aple_054090 [Acrocarpospora pleiomorpha]|uniref:PduH protein n=1 Tax=Acrocarpospora pleiomorpha TaxID=90975 RepID=A0A5M3XSE4_9ACTN|nr:glycerol dehydratase reactivase beta/small subunit family protein [Acrocarpospora pleiomorpha]GES22511.1 hypothetical protein Aple_054090 [Acrocarpospora pleiomorpha]
MLSGDLRDRDKRDRPTVVVRYRPDPANRLCLREIGAGLEEEGVPFRAEPVERGQDHATARELAYAAALASHLGVGVGVDAAGNTCVHHAKLPPDVPVMAGPPSTARRMGHNAARLVVGIAFKK